MTFAEHLLQALRRVALRIETHEQNLQARAFGFAERALCLLESIDDERTDVRARGVEHAHQLRRAAALREREALPVLVDQCDWQTIERVARNFGAAGRRRALQRKDMM